MEPQAATKSMSKASGSFGKGEVSRQGHDFDENHKELVTAEEERERADILAAKERRRAAKESEQAQKKAEKERKHLEMQAERERARAEKERKQLEMQADRERAREVGVL